MPTQGNTALRVGIIGVGAAGRAHLRGFAAQPDAEIVAIADTSPALLNQRAAEYGVPDCYTDYHELLAREDIDAISTATPNFLHEPVVVAAVQAGKHALTEKPLAHTLEAAERMVAAAQEHNRVLQMVYNQRCQGDVTAMKQFIDEGGMGRIYHGKARWMRRQGIPGRGGWFSQRELSGGGPMIDLGIHVLDMALYLMGEPKPLSVSAAAYAEHGKLGRGYRQTAGQAAKHNVEDYLTGFIRLEGGATLTLDVSWETYSRFGDDFGVALYGTEGGGEIDIQRYDRSDSLRLYTDVAGLPATINPQLAVGEGHTQVIREFIDRVRSGDWAEHHGQHALKRTRIVDACYRSATEGREIVL